MSKTYKCQSCTWVGTSEELKTVKENHGFNTYYEEFEVCPICGCSVEEADDITLTFSELEQLINDINAAEINKNIAFGKLNQFIETWKSATTSCVEFLRTVIK